MMDSTNGSAPPTPAEENEGGGEQDPWATLAAAAAGEENSAAAAAAEESTSTPSTEPISVSHAEGETFSMPETNAPPKNEFLTAVTNLGSVIKEKAAEVDQQHHVSEKWGNVTATTKQKTGEINEKYQVSEKWGSLTKAVSVKVQTVKEDPKTKETTENVKRSLAGAGSWVSQRLQAIQKPPNNGGQN